jgi:hypothetical protein
MHKAFANHEEPTNDDSGFSSYKFDFPLVEKKARFEKQPLSTIGRSNEKPRAFVGMNPKLVNN